jgi:hypothetical protein
MPQADFEAWWKVNTIPYGSATPRDIAWLAWQACDKDHARRIAEAYGKGGKNAVEEGAG